MASKLEMVKCSFIAFSWTLHHRDLSLLGELPVADGCQHLVGLDA